MLLALAIGVIPKLSVGVFSDTPTRDGPLGIRGILGIRDGQHTT